METLTEILKALGGFLTGLAALIAVLKNPPRVNTANK